MRQIIYDFLYPLKENVFGNLALFYKRNKGTSHGLGLVIPNATQYSCPPNIYAALLVEGGGLEIQQLAEHLPNVHEALGLVLSTT